MLQAPVTPSSLLRSVLFSWDNSLGISYSCMSVGTQWSEIHTALSWRAVSTGCRS